MFKEAGVNEDTAPHPANTAAMFVRTVGRPTMPRAESPCPEQDEPQAMHSTALAAHDQCNRSAVLETFDMLRHNSAGTPILAWTTRGTR